jgi:hypothetical protein
MLNVFKMSVVMLSAVIPSVFILNVVGPSVTIVAVTSVFAVKFAYVNETLEPDREASDTRPYLLREKLA